MRVTAGYAGVVSLVLFWPAAQLLAANQSFQIIGGWSLLASAVFAIAFLVVPVGLLAMADGTIARIRPTWVGAMRGAIVVVAAGLMWAQFTYQELSGWLNQLGESALKQGVVLIGGIAAVAIAFRIRRLLVRQGWMLNVFALATIVALSTVPMAPETEDQLAPPDAPRAEAHGPIFLLVLDGLSLMPLLDGDRIDQTRFPTFARLSREWTWFRQASTNATSTLLAQPMLFSGHYPDSRAALPYGPGRSEHLFTLLGSSYNVEAYMPGQGLCNSAVELCLEDPTNSTALGRAIALNKALFAAWWEVSVPARVRQIPLPLMPLIESWRFDWRGPTSSDPRARDASYMALFKAQFERFLKAAAGAEHRSFFVHWSMLPHFPYVVDASGHLTFPEPGDFLGSLDEVQRAQAVENYKRQIEFTDSLLARFLDGLERSDSYRDSIVVVTADHGTSYVGDNYILDPEVYRIPLFVKAPGLAPGVDDRNAQTVDVAPTIAHAAGLNSYSFDGHSLLDPARDVPRLIYKLGRPGMWRQESSGEWRQYPDLEAARAAADN